MVSASRAHLICSVPATMPRRIAPAPPNCFGRWAQSKSGRAAISGWRDLLAPALRAKQIVLWPFAAELSYLLAGNQIVVAEAYPAETYTHMGLPRSFGKGQQPKRMEQADAILSWCHKNEIALQPELESDIRNGFGPTPQGEDMFDSVIGTLGLIEAATNPTRFAAPIQAHVTQIEGWILGMSNVPVSEVSPSTRPVAPRGPSNQLTATSHSRACPACQTKVFARWPWGWDNHAASQCTGLSADTEEGRKQEFRALYLKATSE